MSSAPPPGPYDNNVPYGEGVDLVRDLLNRSPVPIVIFGLDQVILYANRPFEEVFGYTREEIHRSLYETLFPERLRDDLRTRLMDYLSQPDREPIAYRPAYTARRKDGSEFPMQYTATVIENRHGTWVVVSIFDVSREEADASRIEGLTRAYRSLAEMNEAVLRARSPAALYADTCAVAVEEGGVLAAWVGEETDGRIVPVGVAGGLDDYVRGLEITTEPSLPTSRGPTGRAFREGVAVTSRSFAEDPQTGPWHAAASRAGIRSSVSLPLRRRGRVTAVLSMYSDQDDAFDGTTGHLLRSLADNVSFALDALDAAEQLARVSEQREVLLRRLAEAQEFERRRLAADLHDEPVQTLAALELRLGVLQQLVPQGGPEVGAQLQTARELVADTVASLRELMFDLEPTALGTGLREAIMTAVDHVFPDDTVELEVRCEEVPLSEAVRSQAVRIVREALTNVRKHAQAQRAHVVVTEHEGGALMRIWDEGATLDPALADGPRPDRGHRGMQTMRERAELSGGSLTTRVTDGGGLELTVWLPGPAARTP